MFCGYAFVVTGGRNVDIYSPYATGIANEESQNNSRLGDVKDKLCYMLVLGSSRAVKISNAGFHESSDSKIPSSIKHEIIVGKEAVGLDLSYNPRNAVMPT